MSEETVIEEADMTEVVQESPVQEDAVDEAPTEVQVPASEKQPERIINIDGKTAFSLKMMQFDKDIAEAESKVADLKKEKVTYIYDANLQELMNADMQRKIQAETEKKVKEEYQQKLAKADSSS